METLKQTLEEDQKSKTYELPPEHKSSSFAKVVQKQHRVVIKLVGSPRSDVDVDLYLSEFGKILESEKPFLALFDASEVGYITPTQIYRQATFLRDRDKYSKIFMKRAAVIVKSDFSRSMLNLLFSIRQPACPLKICESMKEAQEYLKECPFQFDSTLYEITAPAVA